MVDPPGTEPEPAGLALAGLPSPELLRAGVGLLLGALASTFGAFMLGEYQFEGRMPPFAGLLFGLVVGEVVVEAGRRRTAGVAVGTGLVAAAGLVWAGWISGGEGLEPIPGGAWLAAGVALLTAAARTYDRHARRPAADAQPGPS